MSTIDAVRSTLGALLRCGVALAGANQTTANSSSGDDGLLSAEELAALDLSSARWAVVSACGSGLGAIGDLRGGAEGVFGLRRALKIAGARTTILSLWPVEDRATREWMIALYRARYAKGLSTVEATRRATLEVLTVRRARGESIHPFYWAGFVPVGDWR